MHYFCQPAVTDGSQTEVKVKPVPRPRSKYQPKEQCNNSNTSDCVDKTTSITSAAVSWAAFTLDILNKTNSWQQVSLHVFIFLFLLFRVHKIMSTLQSIRGLILFVLLWDHQWANLWRPLTPHQQLQINTWVQILRQMWRWHTICMHSFCCFVLWLMQRNYSSLPPSHFFWHSLQWSVLSKHTLILLGLNASLLPPSIMADQLLEKGHNLK